MNTTEFETAAQEFYTRCFGPTSDAREHYDALQAAEASGDDDQIEELRTLEEESALSFRQLTHSFVDTCQWEILLCTGGPAARVLVDADEHGHVEYAEFQYQDWYRSWTTPEQDATFLRDWAETFFWFECPCCERGF